MVKQQSGKQPVRNFLFQKRKKQGLGKSKTAHKAVELDNEYSLQDAEVNAEWEEMMDNVTHIVIHSTGTPINKPNVDLDTLPYHFVITANGKLVSVREFEPKMTTIEIALIGGIGKDGNHCDTRTKKQSDVLFGTLVSLTEIFNKAAITGADQIYMYNHVNPGFNVTEWLQSYIPDFLQDME